jgi:hypothetical protein
LIVLAMIGLYPTYRCLFKPFYELNVYARYNHVAPIINCAHTQPIHTTMAWRIARIGSRA